MRELPDLTSSFHPIEKSNNNDINNNDESFQPVFNLFFERFDKIETKLSEKNNEEIKNKIFQSFKCVVCFESRPNSFFACYFCGRFLGCFVCIKRLTNCPICRKSFKCSNCQHILPKNALFIPGMEDYSSAPTRMANIISDDTESDDDDNEFVHLTAAQHAQQFVPTTST